MKNGLITIAVGFLNWLIPFAVGFSLLPFVHMHTSLFDTLVSLAMIAGTTFLSLWYLKMTQAHEAGYYALFGIGVIWMFIAIVIDVPIMVIGPVGMGMHEYIADIGLMYIGFPMILVGIGSAMRAGVNPA